MTECEREICHFRVNGLSEELATEQATAIVSAIWTMKGTEAVVMMAGIAECDEERAFSGVRPDEFLRRQKDDQILILSEVDAATACLRNTWRVSYGLEIWLVANPLGGLRISLGTAEKTCFGKNTWASLILEILGLTPHRLDKIVVCLLRHFGLVLMRDHDGQYLDIYCCERSCNDMQTILERHFAPLGGVTIEDRSKFLNARLAKIK